MLLAASHVHAQPLFTLLPAERTGIRFQNHVKESPELNVLTYEYFYNGGGVAVGDLNHDDLPDIVFTANMDEPRVYFNKGNFSFEDVSKKSKIQGDGWKTGVTMADVNADGWLDVYICRSGSGSYESRRNLLFINQKNGTFKELGPEYGIDDAGYSTQAAFFDYDHDGDLDLFLMNHPVKRLTRFDVGYMKTARDKFAGDKLFRHDGDHFTDVSVQAGIIGNPIGFGLGIAIADFNADGWSDMYVSNDYDEDDYLYINQKNGTFKESLTAYMGHTSKFSMGSDVADVNNDGLLDLYTLDMLPEDNKRQKLLKGPDGYDFFQMLLRNGYYYQYMRNMLHVANRDNKNIEFSEVGQLSGISNTDWSWSALFGDYDLDGWQDLFVSNGYMRDYTNMDFLKYTAPEELKKAREAGKEPDLYGLVKKMPASQVKNYLFRNKGNLQFENTSQLWGMETPSLSNGAAYGDFDNDGDWDLVVNNINQPAFIWQNHAETLKNNYLKVRLTGDKNNPFGIGARVMVTGDSGFVQVQELELSHGFQSSSEPCLLFGLGKRSLVTVTVSWPDGKTQVIERQGTNQTLRADYKNAENSLLPSKEPDPFFREDSSGGVRFRHVEDEYNDFKREPLLPHQYTRNGPALAAADVNGDGRADFYAGGAKGQAGVLYINEGLGKFRQTKVLVFEEHASFEDVDAFFADLDKDKDADLYVVSGGNETGFTDRIYWNDGRGNFTYKASSLPPTESSGGCAVAIDFDHDGDLDLFRGGAVTTGSYPKAPRSYLFQNDHGTFKDVTPGFLDAIGMVNAVKVADLNKDGLPDLVIAGEFMPVTIVFGLQNTPFFSKEHLQEIPHSSGWWTCLEINDIDDDGNADIIAGNHGLNSQMKPTPEEPVTIDAGDIDNNGSIDPLLSYYIQGKSYPMASRDELLDQIPSLKARFPSYAAYSNATVKDIFNAEQLGKAIKLQVEEFRTGIFMNDGKSFHFKPLPNQTQAFPVRDLLVGDFNKDGSKDLLLVGNDFAVRAQSGRYEAGKGLLLAQTKGANFSVVNDSGFHTCKDARKLIKIDQTILVANNNESLQTFQIR